MKRKTIRKRALTAILAAMMAVSTWMPSDQVMAQTAQEQKIQTEVLAEEVQGTETEGVPETEETETQIKEPESETETGETETESEETEAQTEEPETETQVKETETETQTKETESEETETQIEELDTEIVEVETEEIETEEVVKTTDFDVSNAVNIQLDKKYTGKLTTSSSYTAYRFTLGQSGTVNIDGMSTDMSEMAYVLLDENQKILKSWKTELSSGTGWNSIYEDVVLTSGTYYLLIGNTIDSRRQYNDEVDDYEEIVYFNNCRENGSFTLTLKNKVTGESFPEKNGGSNNTRETANTISLGKTYTSQIALNDEEDYYKFSLNASSEIELSMFVGENLYYSIYTKNGEMIFLSTPTLDDWDEDVRISANESHSYHLTKGTFYIRFFKNKYVQTVPQQPQVFKFRINASKVDESFEDAEGGTNNTLATANKISLGKHYFAQIAENDTTDCFKFELKTNKKIDIVRYQGAMAPCDIYDSHGQYVSSISDAYVTLNLKKGTYYLTIEQSAEVNFTGICEFSVREHRPNAAQFTKVSNLYAFYLNKCGIILEWNNVETATKYKIYRKEGKGSYKLIKTVKAGTTREFWDKDVKDGKTYTYKIKTLEGKLVSDDSEERTICCDNPNVKKYTVTFNANGGQNLSMASMRVKPGNKVGKLPSVQKSGYSLKGWYTKKSGGKKVTSKTKISKNQTLYAQWTKTKKPSAVGKITVSSKKKGQIAVTCKTVKNASGYEISYSTNPKFAKGATKKVNTKNGKAAIKKLKSGKKYYVRVRAYKKDSTGKKYYGKYSGTKNIKVKK